MIAGHLSVTVTDRRHQRLMSTCSRLQARRHVTPVWEKLYVSEKHRYVYCCTPKVACSSWKLMMMRLPGEDLSRIDNGKLTGNLDGTSGKGIVSSCS